MSRVSVLIMNQQYSTSGYHLRIQQYAVSLMRHMNIKYGEKTLSHGALDPTAIKSGRKQILPMRKTEPARSVISREQQVV